MAFHSGDLHFNCNSVNIYEPVILPRDLRGYAKYIVVIHPEDGIAYSIGIRHACYTQGIADILNKLGEQRLRKHKKPINGYLCASIAQGRVCANGFQCPEVHVTEEGYANRREWNRPLKSSARPQSYEAPEERMGLLLPLLQPMVFGFPVAQEQNVKVEAHAAKLITPIDPFTYCVSPAVQTEDFDDSPVRCRCYLSTPLVLPTPSLTSPQVQTPREFANLVHHPYQSFGLETISSQPASMSESDATHAATLQKHGTALRCDSTEKESDHHWDSAIPVPVNDRQVVSQGCNVGFSVPEHLSKEMQTTSQHSCEHAAESVKSWCGRFLLPRVPSENSCSSIAISASVNSLPELCNESFNSSTGESGTAESPETNKFGMLESRCRFSLSHSRSWGDSDVNEEMDFTKPIEL